MFRLPLADEVLLFGYNPRSGKLIMYGAVLDVGVAAALIAELVMADRVHVIDKRLFVADRRAMSDVALDPVLADVCQHDDGYTLSEWIGLLHPKARRLVLHRLSHSGLVTLARYRPSGSPDSIRIRPVDELAAFGPWLRLSYYINLGAPAAADAPTVTLAALAHVLRVDERRRPLEIAASRRRVREWIGDAPAALPPDLGAIVKAAGSIAETMIMRQVSRLRQHRPCGIEPPGRRRAMPVRSSAH